MNLLMKKKIKKSKNYLKFLISENIKDNKYKKSYYF